MRLLLFLFGLYQLTEGISLITHEIKVIPGASFIQYMTQMNEMETIQRCILQYGASSSNVIPIPMDDAEEIPPDTIFGERISRLPNNLCGFKIDDHQESDPEDMSLLAYYTDLGGNEHILEEKFKVRNVPFEPVVYQVLDVVLGSSVQINCAISSDQKSCTLLDPRGNMANISKSSCEVWIPHVAVNHLGNWTCNAAIIASSEFYTTHIYVRLIKEPTINTWYKEKDGFGMIGCSFVSESETKRPSFCQFTDPSHTIYTVSRGSGATKRYTSLGTDYDNGICQIEFKLPARLGEIGNWKCILETETGGFIYVPPPTRALQRIPLKYPKHTVTYLKVGQPLKIFCQVPYSSKACYIESPNNEYIIGGNEDIFRLGECGLVLKISTLEHLGVWTCHYAKPDSALDDLIQVEVIELDGLASKYKDVEVRESENAELMCQSTTPILSCQYTDPSGISYNVHPEKKAEGIDYVGRGLEYGDCGLRIESVKYEHDGVWTCIVNSVNIPDKFIEDVARISVNSFPEMPNVSTAAAIGVPVGVIAVALFVLSFAMYKRFKGRAQHVPNGRSSNNSNGSTSGVPIINAQIQNDYNTTTL